tara:strand:+ start:697 stop:867 length:171 start_codon:yes stop_codon:yes gene_type:complete
VRTAKKQAAAVLTAIRFFAAAYIRQASVNILIAIRVVAYRWHSITDVALPVIVISY